ncbi:sensor domain-containing diguanylate cyclase [Cohnella sp. WQ 127256]|uniref:sensor domain-containing diguanylate cyclase n=1 Tax=Cohnella sp. WQ 127256 TaxID=2938790 RepID=UPI002117E61C|nr:sensor domain-containing diguanylate cyclase [Cohnella sp. WQ 127256]
MNYDVFEAEGYVEASHQQAEERLRLHAKVFECSDEGMMITDTKNRILCVNPAFTKLTGYTMDEVIGHTPRIISSGNHEAQFYIRMWATIHETGNWRGEIWNRRKNGELFPERLSINAIRDDEGRTINYVGIFSDITIQKKSEEHLTYLAHYDELTGLPNRSLFLETLKDTLLQAKKSSTMAALLFIDLNNFKLVNDRFGHVEGDKLLRLTAKRIKQSVRQSDLVSRLAGDEFTVILPYISTRKDAERVKSAIVQNMLEPFIFDEQEMVVTASVGISVFPEDAEDLEQMLRKADFSMYADKKRKAY